MPETKKAASVPPYAGLKVLEVGVDIDGEMTGKLLAGLGAEVTKVEPPEGAPTRRVGPFASSADDSEESLAFWFYNVGKRSIVVADTSWTALLGDIDVLICGLRPAEMSAAGIDLQRLCDRHPRLIAVAVTPFGMTGPWRDYRSSDLVALAAGGMLNSCGYDDHSVPPVRPGGDNGYACSASFAHIGVLLALIDRQHSGKGQVVDVAMHDAIAVSPELANPYWFYPKVLVHRQTCRHAQPTPTQSALFRCADGRDVYFVLMLSDLKSWAATVDWLASVGIEADLRDPAFSELAHRQSSFAHIQDIVEAFFLMQNAPDVYREGQRRGLPIGIVNAPEDLLEDEHLRAREFFVSVDHDGRDPVLYPGRPWRFSAFDTQPLRRAPNLGEHTEEVTDGTRVS